MINKIIAFFGSFVAYGITEAVANFLGLTVEQIIIFFLFGLVILGYKVIFSLLKMINRVNKNDITEKL